MNNYSGNFNNGIKEITLTKWDEFHKVILDEIKRQNYVFRGQKSENWKLEPTLNRILKLSAGEYKKAKQRHLEGFKMSMRGRTQYFNDIIKDENEIWAVGQHNFLTTPLLDFTTSPYVAAYFAFYEKENDTDNRIIYAVSQMCVEKLSELKILRPLSNYNNRLINQSGLFIKFNTQDDLSTLVENFYKTNPDKKIKMFKIKIPNTEREICLKSLNKMNINHNTLFPDLYGASLFCNLGLEISDY
ncbi:MAG: FRG domain-containing protein [Candidatus Azobacteroides sp.]|nr:FRG domain-containing protein [Candidatus Azobacteroides sp.]